METLADSDEFVLNRYPDDASSDEYASAKKVISSRIAEVVRRWESEPDWMPDIDMDEEDGYIERIDDLADPDISGGNCVQVSEAFQSYVQHLGREAELDSDVVQGLPDSNRWLFCHYANVVTVEGHPPMVVDFTYSQVDKSAEFPLIVSPREWHDRMEEKYSSWR